MPRDFKVLEDGFSTQIEFGLNTAIRFNEKTVTPFGVDGGGTIDTTGMRNEFWRTRTTKSLVHKTEFTVVVFWNPNDYQDIVTDLINEIGIINIFWPDGMETSFYGSLIKIDPGPHNEGEIPTATLTIAPLDEDENQKEWDGPENESYLIDAYGDLA